MVSTIASQQGGPRFKSKVWQGPLCRGGLHVFPRYSCYSSGLRLIDDSELPISVNGGVFLPCNRLVGCPECNLPLTMAAGRNYISLCHMQLFLLESQ